MKNNIDLQIQENIPRAAKFLKVLSHPERLATLCHLSQGEKNVGELLSKSGLTQSAFSQHLAKLRVEKLVTTRKKAQTIYYSLANPHILSILEALKNLYCPEIQKMKSQNEI